jgi:transcription-repair coupling factor (superfamily II helicase)
VRIPDDYISDINQRLRTYKRISAADTDKAIDDIRAELEDRYGSVPHPVQNLLGYAKVRNRATALGITAVDMDRTRLSLKIDERTKIDPDRLLQFIASRGEGASFTPNGTLKIRLDEPPADDTAAIGLATALLRELESTG